MTDFLKANRRVFESDLAPLERLVMLALIDHLPNCSPSTSRLVKWTGLNRTTVLRTVSALESRGLIEVDRAIGRRSSFRLNQSRRATSRGEQPVAESDHTSRGERPVPVAESDHHQSRRATQRNQVKDPTKVPSKDPIDLRAKRDQPKRATQMPSGWKPTAKHAALAVELGVSLRDEFPKFSDWCEANGKTYKSWNAGFNTWLRNAKQFQRPKQPGARVTKTNQEVIREQQWDRIQQLEEQERREAAQ